MDQRPEKRVEPARRPSDKKPSNFGGNTVWILLGVGVLTLVLLNLVGGGPRVEFRYSPDFVKLVEQHEPSASSNLASIPIADFLALIEAKPVEIASEKGDSVARYSQLSSVINYRDRYLASVTRTDILPDKQSKERLVQIEVK